MRALFPALVLTAIAAAAGNVDAVDHPPITVTRFDDDAPYPPDRCAPDDCSLRQAVILANNIPGHDTIILPAATYDLILGYGADSMYEDAALFGDIDVTDDLDIIGAGIGETVIHGLWLGIAGPERVFDAGLSCSRTV